MGVGCAGCSVWYGTSWSRGLSCLRGRSSGGGGRSLGTLEAWVCALVGGCTGVRCAGEKK